MHDTEGIRSMEGSARGSLTLTVFFLGVVFLATVFFLGAESGEREVRGRERQGEMGRER